MTVSALPSNTNLQQFFTDAARYRVLPPCRACAYPGPHHPGPGKGPHAAAVLCGRCGRFIKWLPKWIVQWQQAEVCSA